MVEVILLLQNSYKLADYMASFLCIQSKDSNTKIPCWWQYCMHNKNMFHRMNISLLHLVLNLDPSPNHQYSELDGSILDIFSTKLKTGKYSISYRMFRGLLVCNSYQFLMNFLRCMFYSFMYFQVAVHW